MMHATEHYNATGSADSAEIRDVSSSLHAAAVPPLRLRRNLALVVALVLTIFCASLGYTVTVVASTRALRVRNALERNQATARLCARLLDEQCDSALSVLRTIARQPEIEGRLRRRDRAHLLRDLKDAVELVPDLRLVALYDRDGRLLLGYPGGISLPTDARRTAWMQEVKSLPPAMGQAVISEVITVPSSDGIEAGQVLIMAVPILQAQAQVGQVGVVAGGQSAGYLLAYYRLGDIYSWLRQFHLSGSSVQIIGEEGHVIATSGGQPNVGARLPVSASLALARREGYGSRIEVTSAVAPEASDQGSPSGESEVVVGYARAERTGWILLVTQPTISAYAPSEFLLRRLSLLALPLVGLLGGTSWLLVRLYHRQERLAETLAERNEMLRRADRAKSDLLANVSHDLKTPIASMQLSVSGLLDAPAFPPPEPFPVRQEANEDNMVPAVASPNQEQVQECLTLVSRELDDLAGRVRNLLDMARLEGGGQPAIRETCDLSDIVASSLERLRFLLHGRGVVAQFPSAPLLLECDQDLMETVVMNLLENAHKYSPPGTALHLKGEAEGNSLVLRVRDEGPGVPLAERERIFEKFYRAAARHAAGGTGLGLAICRSVVESHGGHITVNGGSGEIGSSGAEFVVTLPRITDDAAGLAEERADDGRGFATSPATDAAGPDAAA